MLRLALLFALIIVAFDAATALVARAFAINYGNFALLALVLYACFGIYAGQRLRWPRALLAIAIAVVVDAIVGTYVASLLGAWVAQGPYGRDLAGSTLLTALLNLVVGAAGVGVGTRVVRRV
jgi:hypothetical protein